MGYPTDFKSAVQALRTKLSALEATWTDFVEGVDSTDFQDVADDIDALWTQYISSVTHWDAYRVDASFKNLDPNIKTDLCQRFNDYFTRLKSGVLNWISEKLYFETWGSSWGDVVWADITNLPLRNNLNKGYYRIRKTADTMISLLERMLGRI